MGFCPSCHSPDGLVPADRPETRLEVILEAPEGGASRSIKIEEVGRRVLPRMPSGFGEFDRVLGGGFVPGSFVLLGGDPGVGKSTLILQSVSRMARSRKILYAAGEESPEQIRMRFDRLGQDAGDLHLLPETDLETVIREVALLKPEILVVDSIQTITLGSMGQGAGSVTQLRESAALLLELAKRSGVTVLVIGHVTKEGVIAGPRVLEHLVDTVLYLEGDRSHPVRLLRTVKNRFGPTRELGIFEMDSAGLREVDNASAFFLEGRKSRLPGSVVVAAWEGSRPLLVELQALVSPTPFPNPRRVAQGVGASRLTILAAVLERRFGLTLSGSDIYVNVVGGVDLDEPALDLGISLAVAGSLWDRALPPDLVVFGEIGLGGEVRRVPAWHERLSEAARHGFHDAILPNIPEPGVSIPEGMTLHPVRELSDALGLFRSFREKT